MGRSSAAEAEVTKQKIVDSAFDITMHNGFDSLTFTLLSKHCGVSRSGINRHFPKKVDLLAELEPQITKILFKQVDFASPDAFYASWVDGLTNNPEFRSAVLASGPIIPTGKGIANLKRLIQGKEDDVNEIIYICIGYAIINLN